MQATKTLCLFTALALGGCAYFGGAKTPSQGYVDCIAVALEPAVGDVFDTSVLAQDLISGKAKLSSVVGNLELQPSVVEKMLDAVSKCSPAPAAPSETSASADAGTSGA